MCKPKTIIITEIEDDCIHMEDSDGNEFAVDREGWEEEHGPVELFL